MLSKIENGDVVLFVSGMQGLIVTMSMAEDMNLPPGENNPQPVFMSVELATPTDSYMPKVTIPS
jgi:hypothetical protein